MLAGTRLFVLDMDGTFYLGDRLFPWSLPFIAAVQRAGADYLFLTNNSSRTRDLYVDKLRRLGLPTDRTHVMTSGDATIELLRREGRFHSLFLLATPPVEQEFAAAGFDLAAPDPDAVVLTFDMTLTYEKLRRGCALLLAGKPYVATHPDFTCPAPQGPIPDIGAFMDLIAAATSGRRPDRIVGKPQADFLRAAMAVKGVGADQTIILGDRLYTDIACGKNAGVRTGLVLTGETTREMLSASAVQPDFVFESLQTVTQMLEAAA